MTNFGNTRTWDWRDKLPYYFLLVLCFFPIMPFGVMSVAIILFAGSCVAANYPSFSSKFRKVGWKPFLANSAFFMLLALTIFYSENHKNGLVQVQKGLPLLLFPFVFLYFAPRIDRKRLHTILIAFVVANLLFVGYLFQYMTNNASDFAVTTTPGLILFEGLKDQNFFAQLKALWDGSFYETMYYARKTAESKLYIHKTYASQSMLWCILIVIYFLFLRKLGWYVKLLLGCALLVLTVLLVYFYSLTNLLLFLVLVPAYLLFKIPSKKMKVAFAGSLLLIGIGVLSFVGTTPKETTTDQQTYEEYLRYEHPKYIFANILKMLNSDDRNAINQCNISLIGSAPFFGIGLGDVQDNLDVCYEGLKQQGAYNLDTVTQNLNTHNYYAFLWIAGGIFVLLAFAVMLWFNFSTGLKKSDLLYLALLLLVSLNLFAESTLSRAYGVLFFALWNGLFLAKNIVYDENGTLK